jgi:hypothetical protein
VVCLLCPLLHYFSAVFALAAPGSSSLAGEFSSRCRVTVHLLYPMDDSERLSTMPWDYLELSIRADGLGWARSHLFLFPAWRRGDVLVHFYHINLCCAFASVLVSPVLRCLLCAGDVFLLNWDILT